MRGGGWGNRAPSSTRPRVGPGTGIACARRTCVTHDHVEFARARANRLGKRGEAYVPSCAPAIVQTASPRVFRVQGRKFEYCMYAVYPMDEVCGRARPTVLPLRQSTSRESNNTDARRLRGLHGLQRELCLQHAERGRDERERAVGAPQGFAMQDYELRWLATG